MSGNRKVALVAVVALLVCHSFVYGDYETAGSSNYLLAPTKKDNVKFIPTVSLAIDSITREKYTKFIKDTRDLLVGTEPNDTVHGVPRLHESTKPILVQLVNSKEKPVTFEINVTNLCLQGYSAKDQSYKCKDSPVDTSDTLGTINLTFGCCNYSDLESVAGKTRPEIPLGIIELNKSINHLLRNDGDANVTCSLIVVIQMVSEAVKFRYIESLVASTIGADGCLGKFYPNRNMTSLEDKWITLSTSIQQSIGGVLDPAVELVDRQNKTVSVDSVNKYLINNIAVMLFVCNNPYPLPSTTQVDHVTGINDDHNCSNITAPTIRISGQNGSCLDSPKTNDSQITLKPCDVDSNAAHQLWTLKTDGTIRSIGMCMDAEGNYSGAAVLTNDNCSATGLNKWQVWDDGTIINSKSANGLVLTNSESNSIIVHENGNYSQQGWLPSNNTEPIVTPIVHFIEDLCLQANDENTVGIEECLSNKTAQEWAIYAEGTIRPNGKKDKCLTLDSERVVVIDACNIGGIPQRWQFKNNGTISNVRTKLVIDVKDSDKIIGSPAFPGAATQIWQAWFL